MIKKKLTSERVSCNQSKSNIYICFKLCSKLTNIFIDSTAYFIVEHSGELTKCHPNCLGCQQGGKRRLWENVSICDFYRVVFDFYCCCNLLTAIEKQLKAIC